MTLLSFSEASAGNSRGRIGLGPRGLTGVLGAAEFEPVPVGDNRGVEYDGGGDAGTPRSIRFSLAPSFEGAGPIVEDGVLESLMPVRTSTPLRWYSRPAAQGRLRGRVEQRAIKYS